MIKAILEDNGYIQFDGQTKTWNLASKGDSETSETGETGETGAAEGGEAGHGVVGAAVV